MSNTADPRHEELQLLRQLRVSKITTTHSATYEVGRRLIRNGEAMGWWGTDARYHLEITATGVANLKASK